MARIFARDLPYCGRSFPKLTLRRRLSSGDNLKVCFPLAPTEILFGVAQFPLALRAISVTVR